jgi:hypothetical protein
MKLFLSLLVCLSILDINAGYAYKKSSISSAMKKHFDVFSGEYYHVTSESSQVDN